MLLTRSEHIELAATRYASIRNLLASNLVRDIGYRNCGTHGFDSRQHKGMFSSPQVPDRLWGPLSIFCNGYRGLRL
jgi:hypothetical protein